MEESLEQRANLEIKCRYFKVRKDENILLDTLREQLGESVQPVPWLPGFHSVDANVKMVNNPLYKAGLLYSLDVCSGAVVRALDVQKGDNVLDLCCCPGLKMLLLAENAKTVTGVDISSKRLKVCYSLLKKYKPSNVRVFRGDGSRFDMGTFSLLAAPPPPLECKWCAALADNVSSNAFGSGVRRKRRQRLGEKKDEAGREGNELALNPPCKKVRADQSPPPASRQTEILPEDQLQCCLFFSPPLGSQPRSLSCACAPQALYDRVLVDAECTHDGSVKHLKKIDPTTQRNCRNAAGGGGRGHDSSSLDYIRNRMSGEEAESLWHLQLSLLENGFRLLRPAGVLVYSTCSLSTAQNDDVVEAFLQHRGSEAVELVDIWREMVEPWPATKGRLGKTVQFVPDGNSIFTGMFVAKFRKLK